MLLSMSSSSSKNVYLLAGNSPQKLWARDRVPNNVMLENLYPNWAKDVEGLARISPPASSLLHRLVREFSVGGGIFM